MSAAPKALVYVSCSQGQAIEMVSLDRASGALEKIQTVPLSGDGMPLAISPDRQFLHAAVFARVGETAQPRYQSFRIAPEDGSLTPAGAVDAPGRMSFITVDRSGKFLLGASVAGDLIVSHAIESDGTIRQPPTERRTVLSKAHQITTDRSNRFAFVPNLGAGLVQQFRFEEATGRLTENAPPALELGGDVGPRHMAHHPNGRYAYLLCEFDGSLVSCAVDQEGGGLSVTGKSDILPDGFDGTPWGAQIHVSADGDWLFTSERMSSTITVHRLDAATGGMTKIESVATHACPRGFDVDHTGDWLVAAGEKSDSIVSYAFDRAGGRLMPRATLDVAAGPIWVEILKA